ncbi:MAG: hypothetical protein WBM43_11390 [Flavobacteriaceae bacterium]
MALLVLFSSMSFTVDMHFCGDNLVDLSLIKADKCAMSVLSESSEMDLMMTSEMGCCTDLQVILEGQDELKISFDKLSLKQQVFLASYFQSYVQLLNTTSGTIVPFDGYPPPLIVRDIYILHETYLI